MAAYSMRIGEYLQRITNGSAQTAWAAATSQTGQLAELSALWSGDVEIRGYSLAGTLLTTLTYSGWNTDTSEATYFLSLDTRTDESLAVNDVVRYCKAFIPGGVEVVAWDISPVVSSDLSKIAVNGLRINATASLPLADTPAWRTAMTATDTVYEIGGLPSVLSSSIDWPAAGSASFLMNGGSDGNSYLMHAAYGGSVFVPDIGAHGAMVFGRTGEATIDNQLTVFPLSDDAPDWTWFQQPDYPISEAEAITMGADWYYSEADYVALPSGDKIDGVGEATFSASWDGTFPVGYKNWIARRKYQGSITGNSRPWFFRYNMPRYIPPAMTGTANGAIIVHPEGTIYGPFGQGSVPDGGAAVDWFSDMWGGSPNREKKYLYAMDVVTKSWTKLTPAIPDYARNNSVVVLPIAFVDEVASRIYYWTINVSDNAMYYADFSSGIAGLTVSSPAALTDSSGGAAPSLQGNSVLCHVVGGALDGKRLCYTRDSGATPALLLIDIDANTLRKLTITGLPTAGEWWGFGYRQSTNELIITTKASDGVRCYKSVIPSDPTSAAAYSFSSSLLTLASGVVIETSGLSTPWQYGERNQYIDSLGVVLITQQHNKMLAYRPA